MVSFLMMLQVLYLTFASELNLNELAHSLQESLRKATETEMTDQGLASIEQLQRVTDLLLSWMPHSQAPTLEFDPPLLLDFGAVGTAVSESKKLTLLNRSSSVIKVFSLTLFGDKQFELSIAPKEIVLVPQQSFDLNVCFFPSAVGFAVNLLLLNTSVGRVQYLIKAETTANPYDIEAVMYDSLLPDSPLSHRLSLFNPHAEPLEIKSLLTTNDHFKANYTAEDLKSWTVYPGQRRQFATLSLATRKPGAYTGRVIVHTNMGTLAVPVSLQVLRTALLLEQSVIKLGILTNPDASFNFELLVTNLGKKGITVHVCSREGTAGLLGSVPGVFIEESFATKPSCRESTGTQSIIDNVKIKQDRSLVNPKERTSLGRVSVFPGKDGKVSGSVLFYTNETADPLEVRYHGEVDSELLRYDKDSLSFYPGNNAPRTVAFTNTKASSLVLFNVSTTSPELIISPLAALSIEPFETCYFNLSYSGSLEVPLTQYIILQSSFDELLVPVSIHNDMLECYVNGKPCTDTIDLGQTVFAGTKVHAPSTVLELVNSSFVEKKIKKIQISKGFLVNIADNQALTNIVVSGGARVLVKVSYDPNVKTSRLNSTLTITTDQRTLTFEVVYTVVKGSFKSDPLHFELKSAAHSQSLVFTVTNLFPMPIKVKAAHFDSKMLDVILLNTLIKPDATVELAKVTFGFNELKLKRRLSNVTSMNYEDFSIYKDFEERLSSLDSKPFYITFTTNQAFSLDVPFTVAVSKTPLTYTEKLDFSQAFVGTLSSQYFQMTNTLDQPVTYKVFLGTDSISLPSWGEFCKSYFGIEAKNEEFEAVNPQLRGEACRSFMQEEVFELSLMSALTTPSPRAKTLSWGLLGKAMSFIEELRYLGQPKVHANSVNAFYLGCNHEGILAPNQTVSVGPINFMPFITNAYNASIYIKNNHTYIEEVKLFGNAEPLSLLISSPDAVGDPLHFRISYKEVKQQIDAAKEKDSPHDLSFIYDIDIKNTGKLALLVKDILLNGHSCSAFGIRLSVCYQNVILKPGQVLKSSVIYTPSFRQEILETSLFVVTERGLDQFGLEFSLEEAALQESSFKAYKGLYWSKAELFAIEAVMLLGLLTGYATLVCLLFEDRRLAKLLRNEQVEPKPAEVSGEGVVREDPKPPTKVEVEISVPQEVKPILIKRKPTIPKFCIIEPVVNPPKEHLFVEASSKPHPKKGSPLRCNSESKNSEASTSYKCGSTTPHSDEESGEDVFLDVYKLKPLFEGPQGEVISLAELRDN